MRLRAIASAFILLTSTVFCSAASETISFNKNWKFLLCEDGLVRDCSSPSLDDSGWRTLDVPHDWSIEGRFDKTNPSGPQGGYMPCGTAWYRKTFKLSNEYSGKRFTIRFDGVYMNSQVWINGRMVGEYPNGYNSFEFDITPFVRTDGSDNLLAVKVDNSLQPASRWYSGSGIYRDVNLIVDNQIHFVHDATFARTVSADASKAVFAVDCRVIAHAYPETRFSWTDNKSLFIWTRTDDDSGETVQPNNRVSKPCEVRFALVEDGKVVAEKKETRSIGDFTENDFSASLEVDSPRLWSSSDPQLYDFVCELSCEGKVMDSQSFKVGLRDIKFSNEKGMTVNGVPEKIQGICIHQTAGCFGSAVPREVWEYRLRQLKLMGCNAVRLSHYPQAPYIYEICDEIGLYATNEIFDDWNRGQEWGYSETHYGKMPYSYHRFFDQWHGTDLRNMVRRDRNHACLIMYFLGNEVPNQRIKGIELARELVSTVREEDPTRPTTAGCDFFVGANAYGFMDQFDIAGYNYIDRIHRDKLYIGEHELYPERILLGTETYHSYKNHETIEKCDAAIGEFIWVGFDYLGEVVWPDTRGWDDGIFDVTGFPKAEYWQRKALWSKEPMVFAGVYEEDNRDFDWKIRPVKGHWNWQKGSEVTVYAYSNCESVDILVNGKKLGRRKVDADSCCVAWTLPYKPGKLTAIGCNGGKKVAEWTMETTDNQPSALDLKVISAPSADGIAIYEVQAVDKKGRRIPTYSGTFEVETDGCTVLGLDDGSQYDPDGTKYTSKTQGRIRDGRAMVYLKVDSPDAVLSLSWENFHRQDRISNALNWK